MNALDQTTLLELKEIMKAGRVEYDVTGVHLVLVTGHTLFIPHRAIQCMVRLVRSAEEDAIDVLRVQLEAERTEGWPS